MLMSGEMVRASLRDVDPKTMTRRVLTDRNSVGNFKASELDLSRAWVDGAKLKAYLAPAVAERLGHAPDDIVERLYCRYEVGDRLWMRERWAVGKCADGFSPRALDPPTWLGPNGGLWFDADATEPAHPISPRGRWRPSIHMPRWASRLHFEVTSVRPERVNDISEDDARREGFPIAGAGGFYEPPIVWFCLTWEMLNAKRGFGWKANPWVWVLGLRRLAP